MGRMPILVRVIVAILGLWATFNPLHAKASTVPQTAALCTAAMQAASSRWGVPMAVLKAISLTETGRRLPEGFLPWPWTVNMEGKGIWFDSEAEAKAYVERHHARGARSYDVGCFQVNYRWHGQHFASREAMFDPASNADYAARFLSELYSEFGNWSKAAGAYHSRTPRFANKYAARFDRIIARLGGAEAQVAVATPAPTPVPAPTHDPKQNQVTRVNTFPLLRQAEPGAAVALASLVPLGDAPAGRGLIPFDTSN